MSDCNRPNQSRPFPLPCGVREAEGLHCPECGHDCPLDEPLAILGQGEYAERVGTDGGALLVVVLMGILITGLAMLVWAFCQ